MSVAQVVRTRLVELDRLRGLAILLMIGDHVAIHSDLPIVRITAGRLAVPIFFIVAGHLAGSRLSGRQLVAGALGLVLPLFVPWIDSPNVLVWWALGCVVLWAFERFNVPTWPLLAVALTLGANHWAIASGTRSYDPVMLLGLMALGRGLAPAAFAWGQWLPQWFGALGRRPLTWYVGHLVVLQLTMIALGRG